MNILKVAEERREFTAQVYSADHGPDAQGDTMTVDELHVATMRFARKPKLKLEHGNEDLPEGLVTILGSFMTGPKASGGLPANSWIIHGRVARGDAGNVLWQRIKGGKAGKRFVTVDGKQVPTLSGFSMAGEALRQEVN